MNKGRCKHCHQVFLFEGTQPEFCAECYLKDEHDFLLIHRQVEEHPGIHLDDLSRKTGISHTRILHFMNEDRPKVVSHLWQFLKCQGCGKIINNGEYCGECEKA